MARTAHGLIGLAALLAACTTPGATPRSAAARAEFQRLHPCPATGAPRGPCPGWVVDHLTPLCAGGADHWTNMQWQAAVDARRKDVTEQWDCRKLR